MEIWFADGEEVPGLHDTVCAFGAAAYDGEIARTLPYYAEFYKQAVDVVRMSQRGAVDWLDVGCGTGRMAEAAFGQVEIGRFVFCDMSAQMIGIAKKRLAVPGAAFLVSKVQELPFCGEFDVVTAIQVNHYLQQAERRMALEKCYEALRSGGVLISFENFAPSSEWGERLALQRWKQFQREQGKSLADCEAHLDRYNKAYFPISLAEHMQLLQDCGFRAAEVLWVSYMQAGLVGMK